MNNPNHALRPPLIIGGTSAFFALLNSASSHSHTGGVDLLPHHPMPAH